MVTLVLEVQVAFCFTPFFCSRKDSSMKLTWPPTDTPMHAPPSAVATTWFRDDPLEVGRK
jgi:hypothetical protein